MRGHSASEDARRRAYDPRIHRNEALHPRGWIATELGPARVPQDEAPQVGQARLAVSSPAMTASVPALLYRTRLSLQRLGETELVAVRVGQMEEALAPFGIARRRVRAIAGRDHARMQRVDVGMVEDDASPPRPRSLGRLGDQIEIARSSPKARKRGVAAAVDHLKSQ